MYNLIPFFRRYIVQFDDRPNPLSILDKWTMLFGFEINGVSFGKSTLPHFLAIYSEFTSYILKIDPIIRQIGVQNLSEEELIEFCYERNIRTDISKEEMQTHLEVWLEFSKMGELLMPSTLMMYASLLISPEPLTPESISLASTEFENAMQIPVRKES